MDKQVEQKFRTVERERSELEHELTKLKKSVKTDINNLTEFENKTKNSLKSHAKAINAQTDAGKETIKFLEFQNKRINKLKNIIILLVLWNIILTFVQIFN